MLYHSYSQCYIIGIVNAIAAVFSTSTIEGILDADWGTVHSGDSVQWSGYL